MNDTSDPTGAVAAFLKGNVVVNGLVGGRVVRPRLSKKEDPQMPRAVIVVRSAGGGTLMSKNQMPFKDSRIAVVCYGSTDFEAQTVAQATSQALRELTRGVWDKVVLRWARVVTEPLPAVDPETNWPFATLLAQVMHSTKTVS